MISGTIGTRGAIASTFAGHDEHLAAPTSHVVQPLFDEPLTTHPSMSAIFLSLRNS
jgi:predicted nucleic acid-binding Zn ribbon protein